MSVPSFPPDSPLYLFTEEEVRAVLATGSERTCVVDEIVLREGDAGDAMYIVLEGFAGARLDSGPMSRSYGPGSYFGELSFINPGHRRSATIFAITPLKLCVVDQASIAALQGSHPRVIFTLLRRACSFLVDAERQLISDLRRRNAELREALDALAVTKARLTDEELRARTDAVTGLSNRRAFDEAWPRFVDRAERQGTGLALLAMDLDSFKELNDTLGHAAGDVLLQGVGRALTQGVRRTDLPCRFGGDEFVVLLADLDAGAARGRADALRVAVGAVPHPGTEKGLRVTATVGGTLYQPGEGVEATLRRADEALYEAKRDGKNRVGWR